MSSKRQNKVPPTIRVLRLVFPALNLLAPPLAGRLATNFFLRTRSGGPRDQHPPLGATSLKVAVPGLGNAHVWGNEGPWALLVHGWGADSSTLFSLAQCLKQAGYRAVTFDAPGHGTAPGKNLATMTDFSEAVRALAETLGKPSLVVAHSLGGIAAVSGLVRETVPERLVLISTPCDLPVVLDRWSDFLHVPFTLKQRMHGELLRRNGVPVDHWDLRERGRTLDCPVRVLHGGRDLLVPPDEADKVVRALPRATARVVPDLGHQRILMDERIQADILAFAAESMRDGQASSVQTG